MSVLPPDSTFATVHERPTFDQICKIKTCTQAFLEAAQAWLKPGYDHLPRHDREYKVLRPALALFDALGCQREKGGWDSTMFPPEGWPSDVHAAMEQLRDGFYQLMKKTWEWPVWHPEILKTVGKLLRNHGEIAGLIPDDDQYTPRYRDAPLFKKPARVDNGELAPVEEALEVLLRIYPLDAFGQAIPELPKPQVPDRADRYVESSERDYARASNLEPPHTGLFARHENDGRIRSVKRLPGRRTGYWLVNVTEEKHRLFLEEIAKLELEHKENYKRGAEKRAEKRKTTPKSPKIVEDRRRL